MSISFKVFASYNILQYLCDFISSYICNCLKMPKKSQINEYSDCEQSWSSWNASWMSSYYTSVMRHYAEITYGGITLALFYVLHVVLSPARI
jgi:hypothetical protein